MANQLARPFIIDTPHATNMITRRAIKVTRIRWVGPTTAGHIAEVQNANGYSFWKHVLSTGDANGTVESKVEKWWPNGFKVPTLGSGALYIDYN
jgi:hypothetical protein